MTTKKRQPLQGRAPWHVKVERELREREGVMFISLLTDEDGALALLGGEIPQYLKDQAADALEWNATLYRRDGKRS